MGRRTNAFSHHATKKFDNSWTRLIECPAVDDRSTLTTGIRERAYALWYDGGAIGEPPDDDPPLNANCGVWRRWAHARLPERTRTVVGWPIEHESGAVAEFATRFFVEMSASEADAWLLFGELFHDGTRKWDVASFSLVPYDECFGWQGFTYRHWLALRIPQFRDEARAEIETLGKWSSLLSQTGWSDPRFDVAAGEVAARTIASELKRGKRGNPGKDVREYFDFAVRWLLAQRDRDKGGVIRQLESEYKLTPDGVKYRRVRAERLGFLGSGERYRKANRGPGPRFEAFWQSLADGEPLKELARPLVPVPQRKRRSSKASRPQPRQGRVAARA
jgi:hypothetical protein